MTPMGLKEAPSAITTITTTAMGILNIRSTLTNRVMEERTPMVVILPMEWEIITKINPAIQTAEWIKAIGHSPPPPEVASRAK